MGGGEVAQGYSSTAPLGSVPCQETASPLAVGPVDCGNSNGLQKPSNQWSLSLSLNLSPTCTWTSDAGDTILSAPGGVTAQSCCPTCILRTTSESWAHLHLEEQSPEAQSCLQLKEHSTEPQPQTTPTEGKEISWSTGSTQTNWRKR